MQISEEGSQNNHLQEPYVHGEYGPTVLDTDGSSYCTSLDVIHYYTVRHLYLQGLEFKASGCEKAAVVLSDGWAMNFGLS